MNEADLNQLPLATAADFLRDPVHYDRRASWLRAMRRPGPPSRRLRAVLRAWAETSYSTRLDLQEAPSFVRRANTFLSTYREGARWPGAAASVRSELLFAERAQVRLAALPGRAFFAQAAPFLESARANAAAGRAGVELLAAERPELRVGPRGGGFAGRVRPPDPDRAAALRSAFRDGSTAAKTNPRFTYGFRGGVFFDVPPSGAPRNVMDVFFDEVAALDDAWGPQAERAAASVALALDGVPVPLDPEGRFTLGRDACGRVLVAKDGAGGRSGLRLAC